MFRISASATPPRKRARRGPRSPRFVLVIACLLTTLSVSAQSDLDALMQRVLARRDDNWKKLQQYVLEEREALTLTGPEGRRLYGSRRESLWFPRDGRFIKSPLTADGVAIGEDERRRQERIWVAREEARAKRRASGGNQSEQGSTEISIGPGGVGVRREGGGPGVESSVRDALEPGFVSAAYFLNFKFDPGQYALVGRETFEGRDVLRIEYYPTMMFKDGRTRPNRELRRRDEDVERKMNKVSLVTLWVDPAQYQIVRYEFRNIDTDFLPAQWFVQLDGLTATMEMGQPFPDIWLPRSLAIGFDMTLAIGQLAGRYSSEYHDYRLASVDTRLRP
jgi:hypothetical protein